MDDKTAWALERRFWLDGPAFYEARLDPACLMAFPGLGVLGATAVMDGLKGAPRWSSVAFRDQALTRPGDELVVLGYRAEGRRDGAAPYLCWCTSTYREANGFWRLVQHQQTPAS